MKAISYAMTGSAAVALALTVLVGLARADDVKVPQNPEELGKIMAEAGKPGAEHAKLQPLAGSWTYTCKLWMDPSGSPMEATGTIDRKWVLGGRFLEEKVAGTCFDGKPGFEGFGMIGYDKGQKRYTSTWACTMETSTCTGVGEADASGTKITFQTEGYCPLMKKVVKGRQEIRIESDDKVVAETFRIDDGKEVKVMELVSVRKK